MMINKQITCQANLAVKVSYYRLLLPALLITRFIRFLSKGIKKKDYY
jgi:hypothetical protein